MPLPPSFVQSARNKFGTKASPKLPLGKKPRFGSPDKDPPQDAPGQIGEPGNDGTDAFATQDANADTTALAQQIGEQVDAGQVDNQLVKLMGYYDPEHGVPTWARNSDLWDQAEEAVDPQGHGQKLYEDPWLVVAHLYKALGGKIDTSRDKEDEMQDDMGDDEGGGQDAGDEGDDGY
jgi:hypothetical protein